MITLALYNQMLADKVAGLERNQNFYWEELPLQHKGKPASGAWLVTRPGNISQTHRGLNLRTTVDFYVATENKVKTEQIHRAIREYLTKTQYYCELAGKTGDIGYHYYNVRVKPTSTPENDGATENGLIVKVASAELVYDEKSI